MRIALIGANGQLGTDLRKRLSGDVVGLDVPDFDVRREAQVAAAFASIQPEIVINCAALTNVDACEEQVEVAFAVNAGGALAVARQAERVNAPVVYISTDFVFGSEGTRTQPYVEADTPAPLSVYGMSKLAGEYLTRAYSRRSYIVRTCGLYGYAGAAGKSGNFVETMLRLAGSGQPVRVVNDQQVSPTSTRALADRLAALIETQMYGLYHIAAVDRCTWYEFAAEIFRHRRQTVDLQPIRSSEWPARARRPPMSALASARLAATGVPPCPSWRVMLHEYLDARRTPTAT